MPGGHKNINGNDGNTFSSTNQPKKKRGLSLQSRLKKILKTNPERVEKILEAVITKAENGDLKAFELVIDRVDGKVTQQTDVTSKGKQIQSINPKDLISFDKPK